MASATEVASVHLKRPVVQKDLEGKEVKEGDLICPFLSAGFNPTKCMKEWCALYLAREAPLKGMCALKCVGAYLWEKRYKEMYK